MIILIDNYDSFTYNIVHYLKMIGENVSVIRNDCITVNQILEQNPKAIVISPGPCSPDEAGICLDLVKKVNGLIPILGVCLGHQVIAQAFGAKIIKAPTPVHGKTSKIIHNNHKLFVNIPSIFNATRYHSLIIDKKTICTDWEITSYTECKIPMSISHINYNTHGVQFHPESITTDFGLKIFENFINLI